MSNPVVFVVGMPSSGKTSLISALVSRMVWNSSEFPIRFDLKYPKPESVSNSKGILFQHDNSTNSSNIVTLDEEFTCYWDLPDFSVIEFPSLGQKEDKEDNAFKAIKSNIYLADLVIFDVSDRFNVYDLVKYFGNIQELIYKEQESGHYCDLILVFSKYDMNNKPESTTYDSMSDIFKILKSNIFFLSSHKMLVSSIITNNLTFTIDSDRIQEKAKILKTANVIITPKMKADFAKNKYIVGSQLEYNGDLADDSDDNSMNQGDHDGFIEYLGNSFNLLCQNQRTCILTNLNYWFLKLCEQESNAIFNDCVNYNNELITERKNENKVDRISGRGSMGPPGPRDKPNSYVEVLDKINQIYNKLETKDIFIDRLIKFFDVKLNSNFTNVIYTLYEQYACAEFHEYFYNKFAGMLDTPDKLTDFEIFVFHDLILANKLSDAEIMKLLQSSIAWRTDVTFARYCTKTTLVNIYKSSSVNKLKLDTNKLPNFLIETIASSTKSKALFNMILIANTTIANLRIVDRLGYLDFNNVGPKLSTNLTLAYYLETEKPNVVLKERMFKDDPNRFKLLDLIIALAD